MGSVSSNSTCYEHFCQLQLLHLTSSSAFVLWPLGLPSQRCSKLQKIGRWLCVCYSENKLSNATVLSHWAANSLSPVMPAESYLKNMPDEKKPKHISISVCRATELKSKNYRVVQLQSSSRKKSSIEPSVVQCCKLFSLQLISSIHLLFSRRVHISSVTLEHLKGSYKVEPGDGQTRDSYLKEHNVVTYLVINPKVRYHDSSCSLSQKAAEEFFLLAKIYRCALNASHGSYKVTVLKRGQL